MLLVNRQRAVDTLGAAGVDVVIATLPENIRYFTDLPIDLSAVLGSQVAVAVRREPLEVLGLVAPRAMAGMIPAGLLDTAGISLYGQFHVLGSQDLHLGPEEELAWRLLDEGDANGGTFERAVLALITRLPRNMSLAWDSPSIARIAADWGRQPIADGATVIARIRQVKTSAEVERLTRAAGVAEAVESELMMAARPGVDWSELARSVPERVARLGGTPGFFTGGAGWQGGFIFDPRPMTLSPGDLIRFDLGLSVGGYWSDTGRTACIGEPSATAMTRYQAIRLGIDAALEIVRPGVSFESLYTVAMRAIRDRLSAYQRHHCGHAIGLRPYDGSLVAPGHSELLEEGMTLNLEAPYYEIGWGGLQLEETIVVERDGFKFLTSLGRDLFSLATDDSSTPPSGGVA